MHVNFLTQTKVSTSRLSPESLLHRIAALSVSLSHRELAQQKAKGSRFKGNDLLARLDLCSPTCPPSLEMPIVQAHSSIPTHLPPNSISWSMPAASSSREMVSRYLAASASVSVASRLGILGNLYATFKVVLLGIYGISMMTEPLTQE